MGPITCRLATPADFNRTNYLDIAKALLTLLRIFRRTPPPPP